MTDETLNLDTRVSLDFCSCSVDYNNPFYSYISNDLFKIYMMLEEEFDKGESCGDAAHTVYEKLGYSAHAWPAIRYFAKEVYRELETSDRSIKEINPFKQSVCS